VRRLLTLLVLACSLLALGQCGSSRTPQAPSPAGGLDQNLLVWASGDAAYKRPGWLEYSPATFGTAFVRGDLLRVSTDGQAILVCADLSLATLESGYMGGVPCPDGNHILTRGDSLVIAPQRGVGTTGVVPILLQPRHSFVRDPHPLIRWTPTTSGTTYTVRVWGTGLDWQGETASTELHYPDDAPPLHEGVTYRVTITDGAGRSSSEETTALDLGFALLPAGEVAGVDSLVDQVRSLQLREEGARLVEAEIYAGHLLRVEAISTLASLASSGDAPAVLERLADQYAAIGLFDEARQHYEAALAGYAALDVPAGRADALLGLGLAQRGDGDRTLATETLEQARRLYADLGDAGRAAQVQGFLDELAND